VALAGEPVEGDVLAQQAHRHEQFLGLVDRAAQVVLAVSSSIGTLMSRTNRTGENDS
jgi:hypothetical protein